MNYQLARTNTYLSGQLKIDLTLNKNNGDLYVEDVHLSPVSSYTGFGWGNDPEDLLDGRHIENIKNFYSKTSNIFYEDCLNPALISGYPTYSPNYVIDTHNNDNKMGLYRVPIKTYEKPYAFFCPFWITNPKKFLGTRFKFTFYKYVNQNPLNDYINEANAETNNEPYPEEKFMVSSISLPMIDLENKTVHNKFVKYFNEYLNGFTSHKYDIKTNKFLTSNVVSDAFNLNIGTDLSDVDIISNSNNSNINNSVDNNSIENVRKIQFKPIGSLFRDSAAKIIENTQISQKETSIEKEIAEPFLSDDLVYISFKDSIGWVKGIDPQAGTYANKDISYLCDTLLEKERPLMDNDYYLARIFKDNCMIAQQLINFNFLFDIADIIPHIVYEELQYCRFGIEVEIEQPIGETDEEISESIAENRFETLQLKDFYSNYEFMPNAYIIKTNNNLDVTYDKDKLSQAYIDIINNNYSDNILDYKKNSDFIQYAYKNKLEQNIVHWAVGDTKYIFNLYDGFSPIVVDASSARFPRAEEVYKSSGSIAFSPNIAIDKFNPAYQTPLWCKIAPSGITSVEMRENYQKYYTEFNINTEWIEGVKYDFSNIDYNKILIDLSALGIIDIDTIEEINKYLSGKIWVKIMPRQNNAQWFGVQEYADINFITISNNIKSLSFPNVMQRLNSELFPITLQKLNKNIDKYTADKPLQLSQEYTTKLTKLPESPVRFAGVPEIFRLDEIVISDISNTSNTQEIIPPVVKTSIPTDITDVSAMMNGILVSDIQDPQSNNHILEYGFEYKVDSSEGYDGGYLIDTFNEDHPFDGACPVNFMRLISSSHNPEEDPCAPPNSVIEYRAYVVYGRYDSDEENTYVYGETVQFKLMTPEERLKTVSKYFLYWFMSNALMPNAISFNNGYVPKVAESPSNDSTEVDFIMARMTMTEKPTLYRYDGKLQPLFITVDDKIPDEDDEKHTEKNLVNYSNYIVQYEESLQSIPAFNEYNNTKYFPRYASIGYSSMASEVIDYYHSSPIRYYGDKSYNIYRGERKWYNGSFMYFLPRKIRLAIVSTEYDENAIFSGFANEILTNMKLTEPVFTTNTTDADMQEYIRNSVDFVMNYILPLYNYDSKCSIKYRDDTEEKNIPELDENNQIKYIYDVIFELI